MAEEKKESGGVKKVLSNKEWRENLLVRQVELVRRGNSIVVDRPYLRLVTVLDTAIQILDKGIEELTAGKGVDYEREAADKAISDAENFLFDLVDNVRSRAKTMAKYVNKNSKKKYKPIPPYLLKKLGLPAAEDSSKPVEKEGGEEEEKKDKKKPKEQRAEAEIV